MKHKDSTAALIQGIEAVISKCRASLTVKDVELLKDVIHHLQEIDRQVHLQEKQDLVLMLVVRLVCIFCH